MQNVMLHCNNVCWLGGTMLHTLSCIKAFPEFEHVVIHFENQEVSPDMMIQLLSIDADVQFLPKLTREVVEGIKPVVIWLENTPVKRLDGLRPNGWLKDWPLIYTHHSVVKPIVQCDLRLFNSKYLASKLGPIATGMQSWTRYVGSPIDSDDFTCIERDPQDTRCVIGKLSSDQKVKYPADLVWILEDVMESCGKGTAEIVGGAKYYDSPEWAHPRWSFPLIGSKTATSFMSGFDILVYKTADDYAETWCRVVTEAMMAGLPIVAENKGAIPEQIDHGVNGFLCDSRDDFVNHLTRLVEDPKLRFDIGIAAREKAKLKFGLNRLRKEAGTFFMPEVRKVRPSESRTFFRFVGSSRKAVDLCDLYHGSTCFLLGSGPSLKDVADGLSSRQVVLAAMNNAAAVVRPHIWISADEARNYSPGILLDPAILKVNYLNLRNPNRTTSVVTGTDVEFKDLPNAFFVNGDSLVSAEEFFDRASKYVWWKNVFMFSLQVLYRLGFRKVFTVGCGFRISMAAKYAYDSDVDEARVRYNQNAYNAQLRQMRKIVPFMKEARFEVVSTTPNSLLNDVVPFVPLEEALTEAEDLTPSHQTLHLGHPVDRVGAKLPYEDLKPSIMNHYITGLEHRKIILKALPPGGRMLEWGSGDSTIWFRANMRDDQELVSFENSKLYAAKTGAHYIPYVSGENATIGEEKLLPGWEVYVVNPAVFANPRFDVILVDGVIRNECLKVAPAYLKPGGVVFLHDAERDWYGKGKAVYRVQKTHLSQPDYPGPTLWEGRLTDGR